MTKLAKIIVKGRYICLAIAVALTITAVFLMPKVRVNYDLSTYLSEKTETKKALEAMNGEFDEISSLKLLAEGKSDAEVAALVSKIRAIDGVVLVTSRKEDDCTLININMGCGNQSDEAAFIAAEIKELLDGDGYTLVGSAVSSEKLRVAIGEEMPIIMIIAVVIVLLVLTLTSRSWLEPLIFVFVVAMAIIMNMGTNLIFGSISYITNAVGAILQLALAMDYSIIFLNNFSAAKTKGLCGKDAAVDALSKSFAPIASSALTTIAGLLALVFMSFRIGFDIGCVLSKGIVFSMLCVFLIMPSLVILLEKPLQKLTHKPVPLFGGKIAALSLKLKKVLPAAFVCLVAVAAVLSNMFTNYSFIGAMRTEDEKYIAEKTGESAQVVVLYDGALETRLERELSEKLAALEHVESVISWGAMKLTPELITQSSEDISAETAALLVKFLPEEYLYLDALYTAVNNSDNFVEDRFFDKLSAQKLSLLTGLEPARAQAVVEVFGDGEGVSIDELKDFADKPLTAQELQKISGLENGLCALIVMAAGENNAVSVSEIREFMNSPSWAAIESLLSNEAKELAEKAIATIDSAGNMLATANEIRQNGAEYSATLKGALAKASSALISNSGKYKRMLLEISLFIEDENSYKLLAEIKNEVNAVVPDNYLAGESVINRDIATSFDTDNITISVFTVLAILLIVGLTFLSLSVPVLLVAIIQGAIWISMSFSAVFGSPVFFISYIICICIQMGATIDYGILVTDFYVRERQRLAPKEAVISAMNSAMPTIFTSGLILIVAAFIIGLFSSIMPISSIGMLLSRGSLVSVLTVLFVLPPLLVLLDKPVLALTRKKKAPASEEPLSDKLDEREESEESVNSDANGEESEKQRNEGENERVATKKD